MAEMCPSNLRAPDGWEPSISFPVAYNHSARTLVCLAGRCYADRLTYDPQFWRIDLWCYDLSTKKSKWVTRERWRNISGVAWSPDGRKLAFTGTELRLRRRANVVRGSICVYDLDTDKLTEIADDGMLCRTTRESFPPVWSEDGRYLYYAAITRTLTRIEVATLRKQRLPMAGLGVLTVKGDEIVYLNEHIPRWEPEGTALVMKRSLHARDIEQGPSFLYSGCEIKMALVSPSRRFILLRDRRGYFSGSYVLIDTETCRTYTKIWKYFPRWFDVYATILPRGRPERPGTGGDAAQAGRPRTTKPKKITIKTGNRPD